MKLIMLILTILAHMAVLCFGHDYYQYYPAYDDQQGRSASSSSASAAASSSGSYSRFPSTYGPYYSTPHRPYYGRPYHGAFRQARPEGESLSHLLLSGHNPGPGNEMMTQLLFNDGVRQIPQIYRNLPVFFPNYQSFPQARSNNLDDYNEENAGVWVCSSGY